MCKAKSYLIFILLYVCGVVVPASASRRDDSQVFFVSPGGPATLDAAVNEARKIANKQKRTIVIKSGQYFMDKPLLLDHRDNGLAIKAEPNAVVTLYGGRKLAGWQKEGEKFFSAPLPGVKDEKKDIRILIVNGRFCPQARLPKEGTFLHLSEFKVPWLSTAAGGWKRKPTQRELTTMKFKRQDIPQTLVAENIQVRVYHMWDESMVGVKKIDFKQQMIYFSSPCRHPPGAFGVKKYVIFNTRQGMTQPGQWYLNRKQGRVVYWPLPGEDMTKAEVLVPVIETIIQIKGTKKQPAANIKIEGLRLAVTNSPLKAGGFGAGKFAGVIEVSNADGCVLQNLEIFNTAGQGVKAGSGRNKISRCHIHHTGACGIRAYDCRVTDNRIHNVGLLYPSAIGVWTGGGNSQTSYNEIYDCPYSAIVCGGMNNMIEHNHIYRVMLKLHDGGGIYCNVGKNVKIRANFVHKVPDAGGYSSSAYYLDENSQGCLVEGNLSIDVARPSHNHMADKNTIRNNVFVYDGDMRLTFPRSSNFQFEKNVLFATGNISFTNAGAITVMNSNIFHSGTGQITNTKLNKYHAIETSALAIGKTNRCDDPLLAEYKNGKVIFGPGSSAVELDIQPIDVSGTGPRD